VGIANRAGTPVSVLRLPATASTVPAPRWPGQAGPGHADPRRCQILQAGFAVAARRPPGGAEILWIAVDPACRGCGLGAVLLTSMRPPPSPAACRSGGRDQSQSHAW